MGFFLINLFILLFYFIIIHISLPILLYQLDCMISTSQYRLIEHILNRICFYFLITSWALILAPSRRVNIMNTISSLFFFFFFLFSPSLARFFGISFSLSHTSSSPSFFYFLHLKIFFSLSLYLWSLVLVFFFSLSRFLLSSLLFHPFENKPRMTRCWLARQPRHKILCAVICDR